MTAPAFAVGERVVFIPARHDGNVARGTYTITRLLPVEGGERQYRVKSRLDTHERVVRESQLRRE